MRLNRLLILAFATATVLDATLVESMFNSSKEETAKQLQATNAFHSPPEKGIESTCPPAPQCRRHLNGTTAQDARALHVRVFCNCGSLRGTST